MNVPLESLDACFTGIVPGTIATCSPEGEPNISYLSMVRRLDARHVALSCQFFNKTRRNLEANPFACLQLYDPLTFEAWRLQVRFDHSEMSGPIFDALARRVDAIASHTGMAGVFRLLSADVCEVVGIERIEGFLAAVPEVEPEAAHAPLHELGGLQLVSARINRAADLESLLADALEALDEALGFTHTMVLVPGDTAGRLVALASRGYGDQGVGAEVAVGEGLIGTVAAQRAAIACAGLDADLRYGRAVRDHVRTVVGREGLRPEIPLPGLPDARSQLALPLLVQDRLVGVLAAESPDPLAFARWHEDFLQIVANQIALGYERLAHRVEEIADEPGPTSAQPAPRAGRRHRFCFYRNDDCVFVDGEYLIRNVPGRILWKLLTGWSRERRAEYANRELRLDPTIGLPPVKDNLESRLILLRKRLEQKCPDIRLVPTRRGRFALELDCEIELEEKDTA